MKKIFFSVMAMALIVVSCGNKQKEGVEQKDSLQAPVEEVVEATAELDEVVAAPESQAAKIGESLNSALESADASVVGNVLDEAKKKIQGLLDAGQTEAANLYASTIKSYVDAAKDKLQSVGVDASPIQGLISNAMGTASVASDIATQAVDQAKNAGEAAVQGAKAKAEEQVNAAKAAANEAVQDAKAKAAEQVNAAKAAANAAINNATNAANTAVSKATEEAKKQAADAISKALGQ